jgi:hypothetical protein
VSICFIGTITRKEIEETSTRKRKIQSNLQSRTIHKNSGDIFAADCIAQGTDKCVLLLAGDAYGVVTSSCGMANKTSGIGRTKHEQ